MIERFGVDYKGSNPVKANFKMLMVEDNRLFYIGRENLDFIPSEISLFISGDKVQVEGWDDGKGNFYVCKLINKTLSSRLDKSVELKGYERWQIKDIASNAKHII